MYNKLYKFTKRLVQERHFSKRFEEPKVMVVDMSINFRSVFVVLCVNSGGQWLKCYVQIRTSEEATKNISI